MTERPSQAKGSGGYYKLMLVDLAILERLPREGETLGYHPLANTAKKLLEQLNGDQPEGAPPLTTAQLQARLRSMHVAKLVVNVAVMGTGGTLGWQRTKQGEQRYREETGRTLGPSSVQDVAQVAEGQGG